MDVVKGLSEVDEITVLTGRYNLIVPASAQEKVESFAHNLGKAPFFDYRISFDGVTFIPMPNGEFGADNFKDVFVYTDKANVYFHYLHASTPVSTALSIYIDYRLFLIEASG